MLSCMLNNDNNEKTLTLAQIPHPMHKSSDMKAILSAGDTSIQSLPVALVRNKVCFFHQENITEI